MSIGGRNDLGRTGKGAKRPDTVTSTPAKTARPVTTVPISPVRSMILERSDGEDRGKIVVEVKIQWPCNKNKKVMSQRDHNHNLCEIQNLNSGVLEHD